MSPIHIPPAGYEYGEARRRYVEHYGAAIMLARYQQIALVCLALVAIGLLILNVRTHQALQGLKPLVIRIDDVGRATAVARPTSSIRMTSGFSPCSAWCVRTFRTSRPRATSARQTNATCW
jgi:type IV secretory pathway TrbF-like protein